MNAVEINNLEFKWNNEEAILLSIEKLLIKKGERLFLQGASGSGKSTLLSLLSGILTPHHGSVDILGKRISKLGGKERDRFRANHIGYIFQMFNLLPYLSVIENVALPCHFSKYRRDRIGGSEAAINEESKRLLKRLGLASKELLNKNVTELSLGQQQRVAACRALIGSPEILIADEPTTALDASAQFDFLALLSEECLKNETTMIFVSHDNRLSGEFDRVLKLHKGSISNVDYKNLIS